MFGRFRWMALAIPVLPIWRLRIAWKGVIIGPSQYPWVIAQAFGEELEKVGVSRHTVRVSEIPIRT